MSTQRIYLVSNGKDARLVRASNQAQAVRHVVRNTFTASVASQDELVDALGKGIKVEDASEDGE